MNVRYLLGLGAVGLAFWGFRRWRQGVQAAMVLLVLEGAIRKWLFPGAQDLVYFAKDVLLLGVYAGFLQDHPAVRRWRLVPPQLLAALAFSVVVGLVQIFNPNLPNLLVGVLGFKAYFLYVPLLWVLPAAFRNDRELARFLKRYALLAIPVGLLAAAQFLSPPSSAINAYARSSGVAYATTFGSAPQVRVTGTFSYITGYSSYVFTIAVLVLAILAATRWRFRGNWTTYIALSLTLLGMLMTGSRGPVLMLVLLLPLYWWLSVMRESGGVTMWGRILLGTGLVAALLNYVGSDAIEAFYSRAAGAQDVPGRMVAPFLQPVQILPESGLLGFGIGATHQTAAAVTQHLIPYSWLRGLQVEGEPGQVMLELGVIGFLLVYFVRVYLIVLALRQVFTLRTPFHRAVATSCVLFFLAHLPGGVVFNVTADLYYWFFAGLLFLVMRLDLELVPARAPVSAPVPAPRKPVPSSGAAQRPAGVARKTALWPPAPR